ncbi:UV radiation resistance protein/autophagy-related protein 14, partial [Metarhizium hybridum]
MECHICHRDHDAQKLPFLCAVDARNSLYELRVNGLQALLENESLQGQVNEFHANSSKNSLSDIEQSKAMQRLEEDRTDHILASANKLKEEIQAAREEIRTRKAALARRRSDLASVSNGLAERRVMQQQELDKSTKVARFRWAQRAEATANTRAFLCTQAIRLYGLKRTKKAGSSRYDYQLGRVPIIDLASMDSYAPEIISTSLAHVAHILMLVCHYLSIRLPAEITLPHRDYPRPTIFNLNNSYQHSHVSFPSFSGTSLQPHSRETDSQRVPRPRPLFVDKSLTQLLKEDPSTYSFFLEGVTLLAYNIAWLCHCQGVSVGDSSNFDDICNMGRNLYSFLMSAQAHDFNPINVKVPGWGPNGEEVEEESQGNWLGRYSHGGTFYFLGSYEGTDLVRSFKLPSPMKLADKLKKKLIGDAPAPDWEVLDDDAWKVEDLPGTDASAANARNVADKSTDAKSTPRSGTNGWTKVKHR